MAQNTTDRSRSRGDRSNLTWWAVGALVLIIALVAGLALMGNGDIGEEPPEEEQLPDEPAPEDDPFADEEAEDDPLAPEDPEEEEDPLNETEENETMDDENDEADL